MTDQLDSVKMVGKCVSTRICQVLQMAAVVIGGDLSAEALGKAAIQERQEEHQRLIHVPDEHCCLALPTCTLHPWRTHSICTRSVILIGRAKTSAGRFVAMTAVDVNALALVGHFFCRPAALSCTIRLADRGCLRLSLGIRGMV